MEQQNTSTLESSGLKSLARGLYLVGTPIGNLGDITLRALDVLRAVELIACEDTRQTQKLLNHFSIQVPTLSCHQHNERGRAVELVARLKDGARIALVSDAGMPAISDPGSWLARAAIEAGVAVYPIPGANAATSALIASGLGTTRFEFHGFLPEKAGERRSRIESLAKLATEAAKLKLGEPATLIFYEAPHRIEETLADFESVWGTSLNVVVARELTKMHEEFLRGAVGEVRTALKDKDRIRGEITLLVSAVPLSEEAASVESLSTRVARLMREDSLDEKDALKRLAREMVRSKSELYRELQRERARR